MISSHCFIGANYLSMFYKLNADLSNLCEVKGTLSECTFLRKPNEYHSEKYQYFCYVFWALAPHPMMDWYRCLGGAPRWPLGSRRPVNCNGQIPPRPSIRIGCQTREPLGRAAYKLTWTWLPFWWYFHHWLHCKLSFWQLTVQSVMKISSKRHHCHFIVKMTSPLRTGPKGPQGQARSSYGYDYTWQGSLSQG